MKISYKATFVRQYNKLDESLQEEVLEKIELFKNKENHTSLKVHKLHGRLKENFSFSVNYKFRIVFILFINKKRGCRLCLHPLFLKSYPPFSLTQSFIKLYNLKMKKTNICSFLLCIRSSKKYLFFFLVAVAILSYGFLFTPNNQWM